MYEQTDEHMW